MEHPKKSSEGITLVEVIVVVAALSALVGIAYSSLSDWQQNERTSAFARSMADFYRFAASEAVRTENVQIVFLAAGGAGDTAGTALLDPAGNPVPALLLDDGPIGSAGQNCRIDAGEPTHFLPAATGVNWGFASSGGTKAPGDSTAIVSSTGSSFATPSGSASTWVAFMPDGRPLAFDTGCGMGQLGSGNGGVYLTNGTRDFGIVLTPLGGVRIHTWNAGAGQWRS
jgi:type II secretory pathway pseudopilin PulG